MFLYLDFALIVLATIAYTICGVALIRRFIRRHVGESHTYILSHPFVGPLAISVEAFQHSIFVYNHVDQGK